MPGDYNRDGVVNVADYAAWGTAYGTTVEPYYSADGNGDGVVDAADYTVWRDHLGSGAEALSSVPEPASVALVLVCCSIVLLRRQARAA